MLKIESIGNTNTNTQKVRLDGSYTPITLISHCTVNTSMLRNIFSDSKEEDEGEQRKRAERGRDTDKKIGQGTERDF